MIWASNPQEIAEGNDDVIHFALGLLNICYGLLEFQFAPQTTKYGRELWNVQIDGPYWNSEKLLQNLSL